MFEFDTLIASGGWPYFIDLHRKELPNPPGYGISTVRPEMNLDEASSYSSLHMQVSYLCTVVLMSAIQIPDGRRFPRKCYCVASASHPGASNNVGLRPNVFEPAIFIVMDDLDPLCNRVTGNENWGPVVDTLHRGTKLIAFPWFDLHPGWRA